MSVFREKTPSASAVICILGAAFLLCYPLTEIGKTELFHEEGLYAAMSLETGSFPLSVHVHGEVIPYTYPLYPLCIKLLHQTGLPIEFSMRLLSVIALAALSFVVGLVCYSAAAKNRMQAFLQGDFTVSDLPEHPHDQALTQEEIRREAKKTGVQAAAAGACLIFATVLAGEKTMEGTPVMLSALALYSGWMIWFYFGAVRDSWNMAWILAFTLASLAFYLSGWHVLILFFLPMLFLQRPLKIWNKLDHPGFFAGAAILFLSVLCWLIPRWSGSLSALENSVPADTFGRYLWTRLWMPADFFLRSLPLSFFLYAPFCAALIAIDRNRLLMKYLRRLCIFSLLILWLNPVTKGRDFMLCVPLLATLTALDYWIVVRRHGDRLQTIIQWTAAVFFLTGCGIILFYLLPGNMLQKIFGQILNIEFRSSVTIFSIPFFFACAVPVFAAAAWFLSKGKKHPANPVWLSLLLIFCCMMGCFWSTAAPYRNHRRSRSATGLVMRNAIGREFSPSMTVYKDSAIDGLYAECYYLGAKIRKIDSEKEIPKLKDREVFLISARNIQPGDTSRSWSRLLELPYKKQKLYIWKGALNARKITEEEEFIRRMRF